MTEYNNSPIVQTNKGDYMSLKTEPIFTKEALTNMYDASKDILLKFLELSNKYQIDFTIRISSDGGLSFESRESTKTHTYLKSIAHSKGKVSYIESEIAGN